MDLKRVSAELSVCGQITPEDVATIAAEGYHTIICNRPDGEGADQPPFAAIEAAAKAQGIEARYIPVESGMVTEKAIGAFGAAMQEVPHPILAYCRSGARSSTLWSLQDALRKR